MERKAGMGGTGVNQRADVKMTADEERALLEELAGGPTVTLATLSTDGSIHLVGMYYGFLEGAVSFLTKRKSQKVHNLRRNPQCSCMIETGTTYAELRGVLLVGRVEIVEDPDRVWELGVDLFQRRTRPYDEAARPYVERAVNNRFGLKLLVERTISWDHRKVAPPPWKSGFPDGRR